MEIVKKTKEHTILKKRSGRYGVQSATGQWINGDDKLAILTSEGLAVKPAEKAPPAEEAAPEAPAAEEASE